LSRRPTAASATEFYAGDVRVLRILAVAGLAVAAAACTSGDPTTPSIGAADAFTAIVDWQVDRLGPPTTDQALPVVYVTSEGGKTIEATTQANVAGSTVDIAKVRFADTRSDAIDTEVDGEPVRDDGVLLIVDKFDGKGQTQVSVGVTIYRDETDEEHLVLTVAGTADGAAVTGSSVRPSG
jgi:hypothetical protein